MIHSVFGDLYFNTGWKTDIEIVLFGKARRITVKARSYAETDGLTAAQQAALTDCQEHLEKRMKEAETLLSSYGDCAARFSPRTLLFGRDGEYALLCDDRDDPDDGIAVILSPRQEIGSQDMYL